MRVGVVALLASVVLVVSCGTPESDRSSATVATVATTSPDASPDTSSPATTTTETTVPAAPADVVLFEFTDPASVDGWSTQNDTVMGGVSSASVGWSAGAMVFSGDLSLANNGGFTSAVSPRDAEFGVLSTGAEAFVIEGSGDGRAYVLQLIGGRDGQQRWTQSFTVPETPGQAVLPLGEFTATDFRLDPIAAQAVDPSTLVGVAIYLVDNQPGPFSLSLTRLAVR
jgi:hypothetical protein